MGVETEEAHLIQKICQILSALPSLKETRQIKGLGRIFEWSKKLKK